MSKPKRISKGDNGDWWFECPYCFELFSADPHQIDKCGQKSCGCIKQNSGDRTRTQEERDRWVWLKRAIQKERQETLPKLLLKVSEPKPIYWAWDPDQSLDALNNFINDTNPKPDDHIAGWKDPLGPIHPDNFVWKPKNEPKPSRASRTSGTTRT